MQYCAPLYPSYADEQAIEYLPHAVALCEYADQVCQPLNTPYVQHVCALT